MASTKSRSCSDNTCAVDGQVGQGEQPDSGIEERHAAEADETGQHDQERERRDRQHHVRHPHNRAVHDAARERMERAEDNGDQGRNRTGDEGDHEDVPPAVDDVGEHVTARESVPSGCCNEGAA